MRRTHPTLLVLLAALALTVTACTRAVVDPATETSALSFEVTNLEAVVGPVYGAALVPFEDDVVMRKAIAPSGSLNVLGDGTLVEDGRIAGTLIAPVDLPRINEALGFDSPAWFVFSPPEDCDVTTTDPNDAAIATVGRWSIWDGASFDEFDGPAIDANVFLRSEVVAVEGDLRTTTWTTYVLAASRLPWSATTNGACGAPDDALSFDLTFETGWTWIRVVETFVEDTVLFTGSFARDATTLTLEEVADLGPIGTVEPTTTIIDASAASLRAPLADLFR